MSWGWIVHVLGDHFPDDGQKIGDPEWIKYGLVRGWSLLTQDERIAKSAGSGALATNAPRSDPLSGWCGAVGAGEG